MRALEVVLLLLNVPVLFYCLLGWQLPAGVRLLPAVTLAVVVAHFAIEGQRWQMWPAYLVVVWLLVTCTGPRPAEPAIWTGILGLAGLVGSAAMGTVLPVFEFPTPTGAHPIGTLTLHLVDKRREETQGSRPGGYRELMVQIWYPAEHTGRKRYFRSPSETSFKRSRLALVKTHASSNEPLAHASVNYPVLIFSPSWAGRRDQNTFQAEELASHGIVVVGIDHPYGSELTIFPDGRRIAGIMGEWMDLSSDEAYQASLRTLAEQLRIRTDDVRFVLDELERLNRDDPAGLFTGRLDLTRVGVFGHSFGGAVAAETCRLDRRFAAGINLDGILFGESAKEGIEQPFLMMSDDTSPPTAADLQRSTGSEHRRLAVLDQCVRDIRNSLSSHGGYFLKIHGARHMNFSDEPLTTPLKWRSGAGLISAHRALRIINDYTLAFFKQSLNDLREPLLEGPSPDYPEVEFEVWPPRTIATHDAAR